MIICGNCVDVIKTIDNETVDLIIADPPYGNVVNEKWDKTNLQQYENFTTQWVNECFRVLKQSGSIYVWCSLGIKSINYQQVLLKILSDTFSFKDMIVWSKQRGRGNIKGWLCTREEIFWLVKNNKEYIWNKEKQYSTYKYNESWIKRLKKENNPYKRATNVWTDIDEVTIEQAKKSGGKGVRTTHHPTEKPIKLAERIILAHTKENDLILDPFSGSGCVVIAAKKHNRQYIAIEKEQKYIDIINSKITNYEY